ncbi:MAG TPA: RNA pseudouridine synthase [Rhodocyclaceae bacterium]|nr:MAG: RNA pseudouridine synthase [Betaproteobacteria bacterium CG2_30_68_42]PIV72505.1 MAG: RNA pseudouridine synthase [Rhodocyclales bacterium CG17_big_fil_post_rev_8_21_14_2_50_68_7]PIX75036.1 MAG: RNA pseudouridine synthase [Rhodocyclales bacterium CG_4_10_14_3_um_filter_68_10]PJA58414.1 MAG: RNA pseudouridine synthase [Rhodocyclales bacterium CG_4_9_14_3_um_filter_68_10]HCX34030.1 RNA pseudouridine synthase [Rhodocyclaceae bacterium]
MSGLSKVPAVTKQSVAEAGAGQRVDNYLMRVCRGVPKSHLYRILRRGEVRVNGRRVDADFRLSEGDEVRIPPIRIATVTAPVAHARALRPIPVLFEDDALLVLDKPAGRAVHGGSGISHGVIEQLRAERPEAKFLELVHRLDRDTSGVLLLARKRSALTAMHARLRAGEVRKTYLALVSGRWREAERRIELPLHKFVTPEGERRVAVRADGKPAVSRVRLLRRWRNFSLLEVELETGRTHQIRVHLAHLGFPILGDEKYGDFALNRKLAKAGLKRMFLHATELAFLHPLRGEPMRARADLPEDLRAFLGRVEANEAEDHEAAP